MVSNLSSGEIRSEWSKIALINIDVWDKGLFQCETPRPSVLRPPRDKLGDVTESTLEGNF